MIQFIHLKASDTFSYRSLDFDFVSGLHSVQGTNGSSKTSIFLTLQQCLFNRNSKGCKVDEVSNLITGKPYEIELIFKVDHVIYKVINSRKSGNIQVFRGDHDISLKRIPENLKLIEEILGTDFQGFTDLIYQSKNTNLNLLDASTNKGRAEFVNNILKLAEIDGHLDRLDKERKELEGKSGKIVTLGKTIETLNASLGSEVTVGAEESVDALGALLEEQTAALDALVESKTPLSVEVSELRTALSAAVSAREQVEKYNTKKAELALIVTPDKPIEECQDQLSKINTALTQKREVIKQFNKELLSLTDAVKAGECPTCGHGVASDAFDDKIEELNKQINSTLDFVNKCVAGKAKYEERIAVWNSIYRLTRDMEKLSATGPKVDEAKTLERLGKKELELGSLATKIATIKSTVTDLRSEVERRKECNAKIRASIELNKLVASNNLNLTTKIAQHEAELEECTRKLELLKLWIGILGPKGYRTAKTAAFLKSLNKTMNKYAGFICNGRIKCAFFVNEAGEIDFSITDESKVMDIALWSGGETSRIKLVCLFAVLELLEVMGSTSFNVLCLDEIFDTLDPDGKEGLFKVLEYLKDKGKAIYTIAHSDLALDLVYDSVIRAVKLEDGTTEVSQ